MSGIFDDERGNTGPIWANPCGTLHILPLDIVAKSLKWPALRRFARLAKGKICNAGAATMILNRP